MYVCVCIYIYQWKMRLLKTYMCIYIYVYIYVYVVYIHICTQTYSIHICICTSMSSEDCWCARKEKDTTKIKREKHPLLHPLLHKKTKNQTCFGVAFEERQIVPPVFFCCQRVRVRENAGGRRDGHIECGRCHLCTCMHLYVYLYALLCVLVSTFMCTLLQPKA